MIQVLELQGKYTAWHPHLAKKQIKKKHIPFILHSSPVVVTQRQ